MPRVGGVAGEGGESLSEGRHSSSLSKETPLLPMPQMRPQLHSLELDDLQIHPHHPP